jgi:hypothetical protein
MSNRKAPLLLLYGICCFLILRQWYKSNSGMPNPTAISKPSYAFGVLLLTADMIGNLSVVFGVALTLGLAYQAQAANAKSTTSTTSKTPPSKSTGQVPAPKHPGANP